MEFERLLFLFILNMVSLRTEGRSPRLTRDAATMWSLLASWKMVPSMLSGHLKLGKHVKCRGKKAIRTLPPPPLLIYNIYIYPSVALGSGYPSVVTPAPSKRNPVILGKSLDLSGLQLLSFKSVIWSWFILTNSGSGIVLGVKLRDGARLCPACRNSA